MSMSVVAEEAGLAGVEIRTELEADVEMQLDADRLRRAILNITYNALEAMPAGGTLAVRSERHEGFVRVGFSDTGPGIPEELRTTALEPFVTSGKRGGTGLGLAVVKKVVEDHGGRLTLDKADGGGTLVRFDLPLSG